LPTQQYRKFEVNLVFKPLSRPLPRSRPGLEAIKKMTAAILETLQFLTRAGSLRINVIEEILPGPEPAHPQMSRQPSVPANLQKTKHWNAGKGTATMHHFSPMIEELYKHTSSGKRFVLPEVYTYYMKTVHKIYRISSLKMWRELEVMKLLGFVRIAQTALQKRETEVLTKIIPDGIKEMMSSHLSERVEFDTSMGQITMDW